ncbi:hypothetical protein M231_02138 [Tremella mesenterica]|uniref:Uncharacterized protein n=2 Tax=Tremella mesenterica TaxID=5217 RepID=A0A4Q1BR92_TREME|nr:hypothetical protein M231_02138 [Tremella mesenterica]
MDDDTTGWLRYSVQPLPEDSNNTEGCPSAYYVIQPLADDGTHLTSTVHLKQEDKDGTTMTTVKGGAFTLNSFGPEFEAIDPTSIRDGSGLGENILFQYRPSSFIDFYDDNNVIADAVACLQDIPMPSSFSLGVVDWTVCSTPATTLGNQGQWLRCTESMTVCAITPEVGGGGERGQESLVGAVEVMEI